MILKDYVEAHSKEYKQDKYSMSIRELISMHNNNELNLSPVYQRIFRWDNDKASKLIESLILGIPLPPFFVSVKKMELGRLLMVFKESLHYYGSLVN